MKFDFKLSQLTGMVIEIEKFSYPFYQNNSWLGLSICQTQLTRTFVFVTN
ncbi:hypothetical protein D1AOALGA4SA_6580 [Olavius algarvensis Delta 1 endosymbiont]|nr:hypothetical protein D1AOALGA4SA_6580 [Olavius algarvensis Delta 1 endosymbiont]